MKPIVRRMHLFVQNIVTAGLVPDGFASLTRDMIHGILASQSVHLSAIGRALNRPEALMVTEKRLSRDMANDDFDDRDLHAGYLKVVASTVKDCPFIAADMTDYSKPHGRAFENLGFVRDASSKRKTIEPGYWAMQIEAVDDDHRNIPLDQRIFSTHAPEYQGWFEAIEESIRSVLPYVPQSSTWLFDRGFDDIKLMRMMNEEGRFWLIRQKQDRNVLVGDLTFAMKTLADMSWTQYRTTVRFVDRKTHESRHQQIAFNFMHVRLPDLDSPCTMLVVDSGRKERLVLLTNRQVTTEQAAARLVRAYFRRWGIEEGTRLLKQVAGLENFRVRNWTSIRRVALMAMLAYGFLAVMVHRAPRTAERLIKRVKVFVQQVLFVYYRLWAGLSAALLSRT